MQNNGHPHSHAEQAEHQSEKDIPQSACNGASSAAHPQTREPGVTQQSSAAQALLSRKASVPGHSWLPCPTLRTPDAAQSDYITVCHVSCKERTQA